MLLPSEQWLNGMDLSFLSPDSEGFKAEVVFFFFPLPPLQTFSILPSEMCKPVVSYKPVSPKISGINEPTVYFSCCSAFLN